MREGQQVALNALRAVHLLNFGVGRAFHGIASVPAQHFHHQPVEVLRPGTDHDLLRSYVHPPVAGQVAGDGLAQGIAAGVGGFVQQRLPVFRHDPAHRAGKDRKGEIVFLLRRISLRRNSVGRRHLGKTVQWAVNHVITAAGTGFDIPFLAEQLIAVFHRDHAQALLPRGFAPRGGSFAIDPYALGDLFPKRFI